MKKEELWTGRGKDTVDTKDPGRDTKQSIFRKTFPEKTFAATARTLHLLVELVLQRLGRLHTALPLGRQSGLRPLQLLAAGGQLLLHLGQRLHQLGLLGLQGGHLRAQLLTGL